MSVLAPLLQLSSVLALLGLAGVSHRLARPRVRLALAAVAALFLLSFVASPGFFVQKWLANLVMPQGLMWSALLSASVWALWTRKRRAAMALVVGFGLFWLLSNAWFAAWFMGTLEAPYAGPRHKPSEAFEAVALLGGSLSTRPNGEMQLSITGDRIATAARIYHRGETKRIVCTGSDMRRILGPHAGDGTVRTLAMLRELGVPDEALIPVLGPVNTSEEMAALAALTRERGWTRVGLITSAWHMRRAMRLAARRGFEPQPLPADFQSQAPLASILEVLPSGEAQFRTRLAAWEWLGSAVGR
jgi:uncharacterized SAM-binding protein YcdF (DUF218 family)